MVQSSVVFQLESSECEGGTGADEAGEVGRGIGWIAGSFDAKGRDGGKAAVRVRLLDSGVVGAECGMIGAVSKPPFKKVTICLREEVKIYPNHRRRH